MLPVAGLGVVKDLPHDVLRIWTDAHSHLSQVARTSHGM
ncbi:hypothetical protein FHS40_009042 [Streptomyces spectabilis]|uniref:Uncharacterized protein n=1 Tax=Streptomyces spectabilis TaxID=68270 RepID=A0A7W8B6U8_STRST|nr:hypothetical protein [Streptomyces spectabilis]